jgi:hypothetical protein
MAARETRTKRTLRFDAEGEGSTLPQTFTLNMIREPQQRDNHTGGWVCTNPAGRTISAVAEHLTRRELEALITDAVGLLAWDGTDG